MSYEKRDYGPATRVLVRQPAYVDDWFRNPHELKDGGKVMHINTSRKSVGECTQEVHGSVPVGCAVFFPRLGGEGEGVPVIGIWVKG